MLELELEVELPKVLEMDNLSEVDIANSWTMGGRMHHVGELKDQGLLVIRHTAGEPNDTDIFTKNVTLAVFNRHIPLYIG